MVVHCFLYYSGLDEYLAAKPAKLILHENNLIQSKWDEWLIQFEQFELKFAPHQHCTSNQKKAFLLSCAGEGVQNMYKLIPRSGDSYEALLTDLAVHFYEEQNFHYFRYLFHQMRLENGDISFDLYVKRLQEIGAKCNFVDVDSHIIDHVINTHVDDKLRHVLLRQPELNLENVIEAVNCHQVEGVAVDATVDKNSQQQANLDKAPDTKKKNKKKQRNKKPKSCKKPSNEQAHECEKQKSCGTFKDTPYLTVAEQTGLLLVPFFPLFFTFFINSTLN